MEEALIQLNYENIYLKREIEKTESANSISLKSFRNPAATTRVIDSKRNIIQDGRDAGQ